MSNVMEFGFDDAKVIKAAGVERWKIDRPGKSERISLIAFKTYHDVILAQKTREKGDPLTDAEKADYCTTIDTKLAAKIGKKPEELTEIDKLDIRSPRFSYAFTHYKDGMGSIRCLSTYEGGTLKTAAQCCKEIGDADQTIASVVLKYPVGDHCQVDADMLKERKYTEVLIWRMSSKKYKKLESAYVEARGDGKPVVDLVCELDGDPKFQKLLIKNGGTAFWAREGADPETRLWVLEQGLRCYKHVGNNLGFEMDAQRLAEKLGGVAASNAALAAAPEASATQPALQAGYDDLL